MSENVNHKKRKRKNYVRVVLCAFLMLGLIGLAVLLLYMLLRKPVLESVQHEAGTFIYEEAFFTDGKIQGEFLTDLSQIGISDLGEYAIQIQIRDKMYESILHIVDTLPPHAVAVEVETLEGTLPAPEECVTAIEDATKVMVTYVNTPDITKPGEIETSILLTDEAGNTTEIPVSIMVLADTEPPVIIGAMDLSVDEGQPLEYFYGLAVKDNKDENPTLEIDDSKVDLEKGGEYEAVYIATDANGNIARKSITVTVIPDVLAPVIEGAQDISVEVGGSISYRKGITVTDDKDENPKLEIDNSQVDLETPGEYVVTYTATDRRGNSSSVSVIVTVRSLEALAMEQEVMEKAAEILARITTEDMTQLEKTFAIYRWTMINIGYTGTSEKGDWIKGAYQAFKQRSGDCYTYFAAAKALYQVAGIENVDIVKSDTSRSSHYWSIVNIGDGWYHVDCTPRAGTGDNFFMVTDAELEAYSSKHHNTHIFDPTLYPERATESLQHLVDYSTGTLNQ